MPNIQPISELRNYTALLETVVPGSPVYLTKNGHGAFALVHIEDQEETETMRAALRFMCEMNKGIQTGEEEGWLTIDQVRAHLKGRRHAVQG
ncbi:MAG: prevent-host-death protein [Clostridia bacterium]|nr:prevent-host-death protein [Clostridia bacterium]